MRRASPGFTLFEVLAAVAVLGFLYTILVQAGIQGLRAEGEAQRRLEASILADWVLAQIETGLAAGVAPEPGLEESEQEGLRITIETQPLQLELAPPAAVELPAALRDPTGGPTLLAAGPAGAPSPLRSVEVRVAWGSASPGEEVVRRSFVFDRASVQSTLETLSRARPPAADEADLEEDEEEEPE